MNSELRQKCSNMAAEIRKDIVKMTYLAGNYGAHIGGSLSLVEIMAVLYGAVLDVDVDNPMRQQRDRFILSKGHGAIAQYAALQQVGFFTKEDLWKYKKNGSIMTAHPHYLPEKGIEFSSGSLGQGLALGVGTCLALRHKGIDTPRVYVLHGDGECNEGSVWEAAMAASHYKLANLVSIVDKNKLQYDGPTADTINMDSMSNKWKSFGWDVQVVEGHNLEALYHAFSTKTTGKPCAIICETVKGKGISFIENDYRWHNNRLSEKQYEMAMQELETALC